MLRSSFDRTTVLSATDDLVARLARNGVAVDRALALEAVAAFMGVRDWNTLSRMLPKGQGGAKRGLKAPKARQAPRAAGTVEMVLDATGFLVRSPVVTRSGRVDLQTSWTYFHPDDCRHDARRIEIHYTGSGPLQVGSVSVVEGAGSSMRVLTLQPITQGRKEAEFVASELALAHLRDCPASVDAASAGERAAARMLREAQFDVEYFSGGTSAWSKRCSVISRYLIGHRDGGDHRIDDPDGPVGLLLENEDGGYVQTEAPSLRAALQAVRADAMAGHLPGDDAQINIAFEDLMA